MLASIKPLRVLRDAEMILRELPRRLLVAGLADALPVQDDVPRCAFESPRITRSFTRPSLAARVIILNGLLECG